MRTFISIKQEKKAIEKGGSTVDADDNSRDAKVNKDTTAEMHTETGKGRHSSRFYMSKREWHCTVSRRQKLLKVGKVVSVENA